MDSAVRPLETRLSIKFAVVIIQLFLYRSVLVGVLLLR